ncbi:MAG: ribose-phosphate diphosphokinase [Candidatus Odinarchaeum yellowstonii]|uniref:Ribose-phosphate pyrophosphokinase n=1 Tax=Odinarchaeota yellowstonii (strain LCB_4) TaxID=1841599 RepID=A0AAF0ICY5_ODILC|nr:MAG: ribose-phosphate diphosphokinase [Candidatus Odinarchaeum yellowstonii]
MIIVPGPASQILGVKVARLLNSEIASVSFKDFPDGETYVRVEDDLKDRDVILIQSTYNPQDKHLMQLFLLIDAVKQMNPKKLRVVVPYLAYARQDKQFKKGEPLSIKVIEELIEKLGVDELYTIDIHEPKVLNYLKIKAKDLSAMTLFGEYFKKKKMVNPIVIAPDDGAIHRAETVAKILGSEYVSLDKFRDKDTGEITMDYKKLNVKDRDVVIVDDIISTGGTMIKAAQMIKNQGCGNVYIAATHTILIGEAKSKILAAGASDIIGTDTIPSETSVVSVASLIAEQFKGF